MSDPKEKEILKEKIETVKEAVALATPVVAKEVKSDRPAAMPFRDARDSNKDGRKKNFRRGPREGRTRPEFDQKIISVRRVARVVTGGRRFSFSVAMVLGNRRGSVGVGTGKGADTAIAIEKSIRDAKRNMIEIKLTKTMSVGHEVSAKYSSARVLIMPAPGRGVVAGSAARNIIELAGIKDVSAKILSPSKNQLNVARATIEALKQLKTISVALQSETKKDLEKPNTAVNK